MDMKVSLPIPEIRGCKTTGQVNCIAFVRESRAEGGDWDSRPHNPAHPVQNRALSLADNPVLAHLTG
jgi:hypothetical protein